MDDFATPNSGGGSLESSQTFTFATTNNNNSLFSAQPAIANDGQLTFTPAPNANGSATVSVVVTDNGLRENGGDDDGAGSFTITVNAINDAPVLTAAGSSNLTASGSNFTADNTFTTILEDPVTNNGDLVSTFLNAAAVSDVDSGTITGVARVGGSGGARGPEDIQCCVRRYPW